MRKCAPTLREDSGMLIIQVILFSGILLALIYSGFNTVRTAIRSSNTSASSVAFQDFVLAVKQNLSTTQTCLGRLSFPTTGDQVTNLLNGKSWLDTILRGNSTRTLYQIEKVETSTTLIDKSVRSPDFKITQIRLNNFQRLGRRSSDAPKSIKVDQYIGDLTLVADRRSEFLSGITMSAVVKLVLYVSPGTSTIFACSTQKPYQIPLGPPGTAKQKSGLECIDRAGTPVILGSNSYYLCRIPLNPSFLSCDSINATQLDGKTPNPEGWICDTSVKGPPGEKDVAYAY